MGIRPHQVMKMTSNMSCGAELPRTSPFHRTQREPLLDPSPEFDQNLSFILVIQGPSTAESESAPKHRIPSCKKSRIRFDHIFRESRGENIKLGHVEWTLTPVIAVINSPSLSHDSSNSATTSHHDSAVRLARHPCFAAAGQVHSLLRFFTVF
jgi:hypothetical protein